MLSCAACSKWYALCCPAFDAPRVHLGVSLRYFLQINPGASPNLVNTPVLVKEFGLNVAEQISQEPHPDFDNLITVEFLSKEAGVSQKVAATYA